MVRFATAAAILIFIFPSRASAQGLGFEGGVAGVENFDSPEPSIGVSAFAPLSEKFMASASYVWWGGEDRNRALMGQDDGLTFGDRGIHFGLLYRTAASGSLDWYNGGGLSHYSMDERDGSSIFRRWSGAMTMTTLLRLRMGQHFSLYGRGDLSAPIGDLAPDWGFFRVGVEVTPLGFRSRPHPDPVVEGSFSDPPIRTDQKGVTLRRGRFEVFYATIAYRFTNRTVATVYVPACQGPHPPFLQKWEEGHWVLGYSQPVPLCLGEPMEIPPGKSIALTYAIIHGIPGSNLHRMFRVSKIEGVYRMVWNIYRSRDDLGRTSDLLPLELRVSNPFTIDIEPGP